MKSTGVLTADNAFGENVEQYLSEVYQDFDCYNVTWKYTSSFNRSNYPGKSRILPSNSLHFWMKCSAYKVIPAYPPAKPYAGIM